MQVTSLYPAHPSRFFHATHRMVITAPNALSPLTPHRGLFFCLRFLALRLHPASTTDFESNCVRSQLKWQHLYAR